jgi:putative spermidine/putrescine transport system permease protein
MKGGTFWSWLWIVLGILYFFLPLYGTLDFSLRAKKDVLSFAAYENVIQDPRFIASFTYSLEIAVLTIVVSLLLIVPTSYWVNLRLPQLRPWVEFITLMPFVVPAIVLVFGLIRVYSRPPLSVTNSEEGSNLLLVGSYVVLSFPYMFRAVDTGLRSIDVRTLTEAAQSLGAGWPTILLRVIFPNLRVALLSGAFLTFAIVIGEYTIAGFLARPAFGPFMQVINRNKAYEPMALAIISFALTWASIGLIQLTSRGAPRQGQIAGAR